jgi:hypothetical protein
MRLRVGLSLISPVDTTSVVVVRCPEDDVTLTCGGVEMAAQGTTAGSATPTGAPGEGLQLGKRYAADERGLELLCVRGGEYPVAVDGAPIAPKSAQPLPASD